MRRQERFVDRYDPVRGSQYIDYISKQIKSRTSKHGQSRHLSTKKPSSNVNTSDIFSQPQILKPRRGASVIRSGSSSKYADSMSKFRKDFIRDSYVNYDIQDNSHRKVTTKEQNSISFANNPLNFDQEVGVEQLHYQMVNLHQNVKKMHSNA